MIRFNELRITPDGSFLILDVQINPDTRYRDFYIDSIKVDTLDTFSTDNLLPVPSEEPIYTYPNDTEQSNSNNCSHLSKGFEAKILDSDDHIKLVRLKLKTSHLGNISLKNTLFFVYVTIKTNELCSKTTFTKMCTVAYLYPMYLKVMGYMKELENTCSIPRNLIDMILRILCIETAIKAGNYTAAIKYWKKFFVEDTAKRLVSNSCGCYGKS